MSAVQQMNQLWWCCCSVAKSCLTLCNPMDCCTPGFSVLPYLPELVQIHVHWVSDAILPSHPLPPSSPLLSIFPSIKVFSRVSSSHQVAKVLELYLQQQSFHEYSGLISFRVEWFDLLAIHWDSQKSSLAPQFESISSLVLSFLYSWTLTSFQDYWKNRSFH